MNSRIFWTAPEQTRLATAVAIQLGNKIALPDISKASILAAVRSSQARVLPIDRQRTLLYYHNLRVFMKFLEAEFIKMPQAKPAEVAPTPAKEVKACKTNVHWSVEETELLAKIVVTMLATLRTKEVPVYKFLSAVRDAQKEHLPADRQRRITGMHNLKHICAAIDKEVSQRLRLDKVISGKVESPIPQGPTVAKVAEHVPKKLPTLEGPDMFKALFESMVSSVATAVLKELTEGPALANLTTALAARVSGQITDTLEKLLAAPVVNAPVVKTSTVSDPHHPLTHISVAKNGQTVKRPVIGVLGLLAAQQKQLASKFGEVSFRFFDSFPKNQPPSVDYMVGVTGFMSHATDAKAVKQYGLRYFRLPPGNGTSALADKVASLVAKFNKEK